MICAQFFQAAMVTKGDSQKEAEYLEQTAQNIKAEAEILSPEIDHTDQEARGMYRVDTSSVVNLSEFWIMFYQISLTDWWKK